MLMIGVSTQQNTTNLIPAVQIKGISKFLIIESSKATTEQWSVGMKTVLRNRKIATETIELSESEDNDIEKITERISLSLQAYLNQKIYWNIGGGLKIYNLAMFLAYTRREFKEDVICYANQGDNKTDKPRIDFLIQVDGKMVNKPIPIEVDLSAEEIFTTYGIKIKPNTDKLIYSKKQDCDPIEVLDLMRFKEFRKYFFKLSALRVLSDEKYDLKLTKDNLDRIIKDNSDKILAELITLLQQSLSEKAKQNISINDLANNINQTSDFAESLRGKIFGATKKGGFLNEILFEIEDYIHLSDKELLAAIGNGGFGEKIKLDFSLIKSLKADRPSTYFELVTTARIQKMLNDYPNYVFEAYANTKIEKEGMTGDIAEYDVLLVTQWGTVIAIDAKTFDFEPKDIDARLFNLEQSAGKFIRFHVVAPYDPEDFAENYFARKLKELPRKCRERKMFFFAIADSQKETLFRARQEGENLEKLDTDESGVFEVNTIDTLLNKLNLLLNDREKVINN